MTWVLLMAIGGWGGYATFHGYESKESCLAAKDEVIAQGGDRRMIYCIHVPPVKDIVKEIVK